MQVGATIKRAVYDVLRYSQSFGGAPVCIVTALVRWATGKRLTGRLPKLSLIMTVAHLFPADERLKNNGHQVLLCSYVPGIYQVYAGSSISPETC